MAVRGIDNKGRAIVIKSSRAEPWNESNTPVDGYLLAQYYMAERAIAVSEIHSRGAVEHVTVIADFGTYESGNSPPLKVLSELVKVLQPAYPERLGMAVLLDTPLFMQTLTTLLRPFLATKTSRKVIVTGSLVNYMSSWSTQSQSAVERLVDPSQAMPFMMKGAAFKDAIDPTRQLQQVPFFEPYDWDTSPQKSQ